jgi:Zn-dependent metalloprotease
VSAHANASDIQDFLTKVLHRNGLDDRGNAITSCINCRASSEATSVPNEWRNAAWLPDRKTMVYGQRDVGGSLVSYAVARDVVAHEIFHGVTDHTARLQYEFMSGALNESYSDIFAILIDNWGEPDIGAWDWELGEDVGQSGVPLRNVATPAAHGQPDHMDRYVRLPRFVDHGGVHRNSGIHNRAFHLVATSKDAAGAHLFDPVHLARIFYVALTQYLSRTSTFSDSRRGVELAARTLLRHEPAARKDACFAAIAAAFDAVGITA